MKFNSFSPWLHHVITPLGVGLLFGFVELTKSSTEGVGYASFFARPVLSAILIWAIMLPTTALINAAFQGKFVSLLTRLFLASGLGCLPLTLIVPWLVLQFGLGGPNQQTGWMPVSSYEEVFLNRYVQFAIVVSVVWIGLNYRWYKEREDKVALPPVPETPKEKTKRPDAPAFLDRTDKPVGSEVWALKAEQHYVRVYGDKAEDLILYRFSDALRDVAGHDGLQVHRSYWVAKAAIEKIEVASKSYEITLKNGLKVPVSRNYKRQLDDLDWPAEFG